MTPKLAITTLSYKTLNRANIIARQVIGKHSGQFIKQYIIDINDEKKYQKIIQLALSHNQKNLILLDEYRNAKLLILANGKKEDMGKYIAVTKDVAMLMDTWTHDRDMGYYAVLPTN